MNNLDIIPDEKPARHRTTFTERIINSAKLNVATYEEVEADEEATGQAMAVVVLSSLAAGFATLGIDASMGISGFLVGTFAALIRWIAWAFLTYIIGTRILPESHTRANLGELLRTTGFAQSPGLLLIVAAIPSLTLFVLLVVTVWWLAAMIIAIRQALDYTSTMRAAAVCILGWVISGAIGAIIGLVFSPFVT